MSTVTNAQRSSSADLPEVLLTPDELERLAQPANFSQFERDKLERDSKKNWDLFYKRNGDRFFKNRYWTRQEFRELFEASDVGSSKRPTGPRTLLEIGCGCGDFVLPFLEDECDRDARDAKTNDCDRSKPKDLYIYCCDLSDKAIEILREKDSYKRNHPERICAFVANITGDPAILWAGIDHKAVDIISLIFVLSALDPNLMRKGLENVSRLLKPGGLVLVRDYAIYDKAMLRFGPKSKICDQFYVRQDGTRAYFFTREQMMSMFAEHGLECLSIKYVRRETVNNASQDKFSRLFVQGKFRKILLAGR